jgi:c-di-GMP-binding flagellar brake protein YcgR
MSINRFSFALSAPANERYLVRKGVDLLALLRALAARHQSVGLYFGETEDALHTQLLGVTPAYEELLFAPGEDDAAFERLLTAGSFGVETMLDSIRILFIATHAEATLYKGAKALRARIPDVAARMQRRESVRIAIPKDKPSFCAVRVTAEPLHELRMHVEDISVGGLGLLSSAAEAAIAAGKTFHDCSLELPDIGVMHCTLNIVYVKEMQAGEQRIGCHFVDLPGLSREQLRSYVARLERAQLAAG